jgi:hypothetical protein
MKFSHTTALALALVAAHTVHGFSVGPQITARATPFHRLTNVATTTTTTSSQLFASHTPEEQIVADQEIERLKSMAQKLRAEAAALEAQRAEEISVAIESAFRKFDTNKDGEISFGELKAGLEKSLKMELPEQRVLKLMQDFDVSGDGKLQQEEFVGVEQFRNRLEQLIQEEKMQAREAAKAAQKEAEMAKLAEARLNILNDKEPTTRDKILSVLPYLFPLLDSLQFGRFLIVENPDNPLFVGLALLYALYRTIPFSGFVAFLTLNILSGNPGINRLIRFNMQQAIFLDIALFFPGLIGAIFGLVASGAGLQVPSGVTELGSDLIFGALFLTVAYASISSLLGITPNKIPGISQAVEDRMPTLDMFDDQGRFIPRQMREEKDDDDKKNDK